MKKYEDKNGNSRVDSYDYGEDFFIVKLKSGEEVNYDNTPIEGWYPIKKLAALAESGEGLDEYMDELEKKAHKDEK